MFHSSHAKNKCCSTIFHDAAVSRTTVVRIYTRVSDQVWRLHQLVQTEFGLLLLDLSAPAAGLSFNPVEKTKIYNLKVSCVLAWINKRFGKERKNNFKHQTLNTSSADWLMQVCMNPQKFTQVQTGIPHRAISDWVTVQISVSFFHFPFPSLSLSHTHTQTQSIDYRNSHSLCYYDTCWFKSWPRVTINPPYLVALTHLRLDDFCFSVFLTFPRFLLWPLFEVFQIPGV